MPNSPVWSSATKSMETPSVAPPSTGNGLIAGPSALLVLQDTTLGRFFRLQDTGNGLVLATSADGVTYTTLWQITDVTQVNVFNRLSGLQLDLQGLPTPGAGIFALRSIVGAEANPRFLLGTDGILNWGPGGATSTDTTLSRVGVGILQTALLRATSSPSIPSDLTRKDYVDAADALRLLLAGGSMTGDLVLFSGAPAGASSAAPKSYVDSKIGFVTALNGNGPPGASTLSASATFNVGNLYWDFTNFNFWVCQTGGNNATSVWRPVDNSPQVTVLTTASVSPFTTPTGAKWLRVRGVGGGSGGAGGSPTGTGGSGGCGGGYFEHLFVAPAASYAFAVGAGSAGAAVGGNSTAAGNTTFGTLTGNGGGIATDGGPSDTGGTASGGNVANITGGAGATGVSLAGGGGGGTPFGSGGPGGFGGAGGALIGRAPGVGGGGGGQNQVGAAGANGLIIVEVYF